MTAKRKGVGRSDRYPSDYGVRDQEAAKEDRPARNKSWSPGDKGQGREGYSKGYGGSGGEGTGPADRTARSRPAMITTAGGVPDPGPPFPQPPDLPPDPVPGPDVPPKPDLPPDTPPTPQV